MAEENINATAQNDAPLNMLNNIDDNEFIRPLVESIDSIMNLPDAAVNEKTVDSLTQLIQDAMNGVDKNAAVRSMLDAFADQTYTKKQAAAEVEATKDIFKKYVDSLNPPIMKRKLIDSMFVTLYDIFDSAVAQYHNYAFELPVQLEDGARIPTYAHDTDAAADIYAAETVTLHPHTASNVVHTGLHIQFPEGWFAVIAPRSSIGKNTGLRLSNSIGIIDSDYRGEIGVLYDNISDVDYTINAGDRIAQMILLPTYKCKPVVVDKLAETARGNGAYGSTGK